MAGGRRPTSRQLEALRAVAEAGGSIEQAPDVEASQECLDWGWLEPRGAQGFRLSAEGRTALDGGEPQAGSESRAHPRMEVMRRGAIVHGPSGRSFSCTIIDISVGGAKVQLFAPDIPRDDLTLIDREKGSSHRLRVAWSLGPLLGVAFSSTTQLPEG